MKFLINASNLKKGGGLQVADCVCQDLVRFPQHEFIVVLSTFMRNTKERIQDYDNVTTYEYDVKNNLSTLAFGKDKFLDSLVKKHRFNAILTVFGPSLWKPQCTHIQGFARSHLVLSDSPYFTRMNTKEQQKRIIRNRIMRYVFQRGSKYFFTENKYISEKLEKLFKGSKVFTVTNYYHVVFDHPSQWKEKKLPEFEGITLLAVSAMYDHKNLPISIEIADTLQQHHPDLKFRFVFTIDKEQFPKVPEHLKRHFLFVGSVDITECPSLYEQCDIAFQPTLLECFTATYPEAMRMERPIVTTDLEFARGLCEGAAVYYSPLSAQAAADAIYHVAMDEALRTKLINNGKEQLKKFDNYEQRTNKLIGLLEQIAK